MPAVDECRRHRRVENPPLPVGLYDDGRSMPSVKLSDLSLGGMGVVSPDRVHEGQELEYSFQLPNGSVKGRAVVRWVEPYDLGYRSGLEFQPLGFWQKRRLGRYTGESAGLSLPLGLSRTLDAALLLATVAVVGLVTIDALGLNTSDLLDLAIFSVWL